MRIILTLFLLFTAPAWSQVRIDASKPELEQLLTALPLAPNEEVARRMEGRISQLWLKAGGPTTALLLSKGARNLQSGQPDEAVADFDAALVLEPELIEAFARRALAKFETGDFSGALRDAQEALRREPRHFGVWRSLSRIAEARGDIPGALVAWKKLLEIDPHTAGAQPRLLELTRQVEGEAL